MAVRPPNPDDLTTIASGYRMGLSDQDVASACLRVAATLEQVDGGFPTPPVGAALTGS